MSQRVLVGRTGRVLAAAHRALVATPVHVLVAIACGASAVAALAMAGLSDQYAHYLWGLLAAAGYVVAAVTALRTRRALTGVRVAAAASVLLPAVWLVVAHSAQPEVGVVERSARTLVETGSPYLAHPLGVDDVNPYLPLMSLFGLPRLALPDNGLGDARWWFLLAFIACVVAADRLLRHDRRTEAALWALLAFPVIALTAATGGHDLPVLGLLCLALALAAHGHAARAGLALGAACAMKAAAWPAFAVVLALLVVRYGWPRALRLAAVSAAVVGATVAPVLAGPTARTAVAQVAGFPMGAGSIASPATAPTPGVLLATGGPAARVVGLVLLGLVAAAFALRLVVRPPHTTAAAAAFLAVALTVAALVLPTSRAGYALYPAVLLWLALRARTDRDETGLPTERQLVTATAAGPGETTP